MSEDEKEVVKISFPIITNQELAELDNLIENNYQTIYEKISKTVSKDREIIILKRVIEKQQKELEKKDKIIDLMAEKICFFDIDLLTSFDNEIQCVEYFTKKVDEE